MELDQWTRQQDENGANIQRHISNYKKTPLERRSLEHTQANLAKLDSLWLDFNKLDSLIRHKYGNETNHPYFLKDFHRAIGEKCTEARELMEANLKAFKHAAATSQQEGLLSTISTASSAATSTSTTTTTANSAASSTSTTTTTANTAAASTSTITAIANLGASTLSTNSTSVFGAARATPMVQTTTQCQTSKLQKLFDVVLQSLEKCMQTECSPSAHAIYFKSIEQNWEMAQGIHRSLVASTDDTGTYDLSWYLEKEQQVIESLIMIQDRAGEANQLAPGAVTREVPASISLNLPRISLPAFNGNHINWRQFRDLFVELVHRQSIPQCQKMWYLKTSLSGEAEQLIKHLSATAEKYDTAWKILEDRFENRRLLINTVLSRLLSQPNANQESIASLKGLHDTTQECLLSLKNLEINTQEWDPILMYLLIQKLNRSTHAAWEQSLKDPKGLPSVEEFFGFLRLRFQSLESIGGRHQKPVNETNKSNGTYRFLSVTTGNNQRCIMCHKDHAVYKCHDFLKLTPSQRLSVVQRAKHCVNCLNQGHNSKACTSSSCLKCKKRHNTLLHLEPARVASTSDGQITNEASTSQSSVTLAALDNLKPGKRSLLSTVMLTIKGKSGELVQCRALLDSGSQMKYVNKLGFQRSSVSVNIEGIGHSRKTFNGRLNIEIKSNVTNFTKRIEAHVLTSIVSTQPARFIDAELWNIPTNIKLPDPKYY